MTVTTQGELLDLSLNIARLRKLHGWTQRELSRRIGTSHPVINRWEQGGSGITTNSLQKLASVFGVSIVELFASNAPTDDMTAHKSALDEFIESYHNFQPEAGGATLQEVFDLVLDLANAIRDDLEAIKQGRDKLSPPLKGDSDA